MSYMLHVGPYNVSCNLQPVSWKPRQRMQIRTISYGPHDMKYEKADIFTKIVHFSLELGTTWYVDLLDFNPLFLISTQFQGYSTFLEIKISTPLKVKNY